MLLIGSLKIYESRYYNITTCATPNWRIFLFLVLGYVVSVLGRGELTSEYSVNWVRVRVRVRVVTVRLRQPESSAFGYFPVFGSCARA